MNASVFLGRAHQPVLNVGAVVAQTLDHATELARLVFVVEQPHNRVRARVPAFTKGIKVASNHVDGRLDTDAESRGRMVATDGHNPRTSKEIAHA